MATVGQVYYRVVDNNSGGYVSSDGIDIYSDIVSQYNASSFTKIGVQAPPGTQMVLNSSKGIMVGRTGIYELDEDIEITSMYFVQPKNYVKDEDATTDALNEGADKMQKAEDAREDSLYDLNVTQGYEDEDGNVLKDKDTAYWTEYNEIQDTYIAAYEAALATYTTGLNGVYKLGTPEYKELENIIVDFIYE